MTALQRRNSAWREHSKVFTANSNTSFSEPWNAAALKNWPRE
jgi:hypothetical protein